MKNKILFVTLVLGLGSLSSIVWAANPAKSTRKPAASDKCADMPALEKSATAAVAKDLKILGVNDEAPEFIQGRVADGTFDEWVVYLYNNDCMYGFSVFVDTGTCNVKGSCLDGLRLTLRLKATNRL